MSAKVIQWHGQTKLDLPPDRILEAAKGKLDTALIVGGDKDGSLYLAGSTGDYAKVLWLLQRAIHDIMTTAQEENLLP